MKYLLLLLVSSSFICSTVVFAKAPSNAALDREITKVRKKGNDTRKIADKGLKLSEGNKTKVNETKAKLKALEKTVSKIEAANPLASLTPTQLKKLRQQLDVGDGLYRKDLTLDCSENPEALEKAYSENLQYRELHFNITGSCYADLSNMTQVHHQTVSIAGPEEQRAELIANPESGVVFVGAVLGGGLYLENLNVTLPEDNNFGVFFGRNGEGQLTNVKVEGGKNAVVMFAGAQAYFYNTEITGAKGISLLALSGSKVRFFGDVSIQSENQGLVLGGASTLRSQSENVIITAANEAITLSQGSSYVADHGLLKATGLLRIDHQAHMQLSRLELQGELDVNSASLRVNDLATFNGNVRFHAGQLQLWGGGSITGSVDIYQGSNVEVSARDENRFIVTGRGQIGASNFSGRNINWAGEMHVSGSQMSFENAEIASPVQWYVVDGTNLQMHHTDVNTVLFMTSNATAYFNDINIGFLDVNHTSSVNINNSQVGTLNIYQNSDAALHNVTINGSASTSWGFTGLNVGRLSTVAFYDNVVFSNNLSFFLNHSEAFIGNGSQLNGVQIDCVNLSVLDVEGGIEKLTTDYGGVLSSPCFDPYSG